MLFTLGGTIAMAGDDAGVVARLGGDELLADLPADDVEIDVRDIQAAPSAALSFTDVLQVVDTAERAVAEGAVGVVLTQGTDTLEETAFLVDLTWTDDAPFVLTGAMRNPTLAGADGPANLRAAVGVAASPDVRGRGAVVVFNDELHAPRHVRKTHSSSPATFASPDLGPLGHVVEGVPRMLADVPRPTPLIGVSRVALAATRVALYTSVLDDDETLLAALLASGTHGGVVVAGFGVGHVAPVLAPVLGALAAELPVVLCSRTGAGSVARHTYGAPGSERDLLARGLVDGGFLHPYKARVLLRLLLAAGADDDAIDAAFAEYR